MYSCLKTHKQTIKQSNKQTEGRRRGCESTESTLKAMIITGQNINSLIAEVHDYGSDDNDDFTVFIAASIVVVYC